MIYKCKHFKLYELLPPMEYGILAGVETEMPIEINYINKHNLEKNNKGWHYFNPYLLKTMDDIREQFGKRIMNDWAWRLGDVNANRYRGWRPWKCIIGARLSSHKFGRGGDSVCSGGKKLGVEKYNSERKFIMDHPEKFPYITRMEKDISWLHIDIANHNREKYGIELI